MMKARKSLRMERMRFSNDCSLCCASMVTRVPYSEVLRVAKTIGFVPNDRWGCRFGQLLHAMEYDFDVNVYTPRVPGAPELCARRALALAGPMMVTIPSLNNKDGLHAVVFHQGVVYDPSNKRRASYDLAFRTRSHIYYGFKEMKN